MNTLQKNLEIVAKNLQGQQKKQKVWYDRKGRDITFNPGNEVLMLRPIKGNKIKLKWTSQFRKTAKMKEENHKRGWS